MASKLKVFSHKEAAFVSSVAEILIPDLASCSDDERIKVVASVDDALALREPALQKQFKGFLKVLKISPLPRYFKTLDRLPPVKKEAMLKKFEDSPIQKLRAGFWGLRTLIFMGYYGDPDRYEQFNYTPSLAGNEKLDEG